MRFTDEYIRTQWDNTPGHVGECDILDTIECMEEQRQ